MSCITFSTHSFNTLSSAQQYAQTISEYPSTDNDDWNDPDYESFYKTLEQSRLRRFLNYIGINKQQTWEAHSFQNLLLQQIEFRERLNLSGRQIAKLLLTEPAKFYVFGDIQGAFHSLLRSLTFLKEKLVIDDNFKIIQPNSFIVFNGDFIDRSAYSLECLQIIMLLLQQNPKKVVYIRGKHEDKDYWQNFGLKRELKQRAYFLLPSNAPSDAIPMGSLIKRFFNTLPLALYIAEKKTPLKLIRISHVGRDDPELKEHLFNDFFSQDTDETISYYDIRQRKPAAEKPHIGALITTESWLEEHRATQGLGLLDQDLGTTSWSIVSSPIMAYQSYYNFYYDAFIEIDAKLPLNKAIIKLWNNNIKTPTNFTHQTSYNLVTSIPISKFKEEQLSKPDIRIGSTMSLKRGVAIMGKRIKRGMDIRINRQNQSGGINGQHIEVIIYNDDYTPFLARQNINHLINTDNTHLILLPIGSPTLNSYIDYAKDNTLTILFPVTGSPLFRNPDLKGIVNFRPSYADEVQILLDYLFTEYGARKFLFFYQNDSYGLSALKQAHEELKKRGITDWIDVPYARGETNLTKQANIIKNAQVDAIGLFSTAKATEELFRQTGVDSLSNKKLFGISFLGEVSFREYIKAHGLQVLLGAAVPNPATSDLEAAVLYREAMDKNNLPYDAFSLESFLTTSLLIDVMKRIKGPITREKIAEKLEAFYDDKFQGLTLTYNPKTRSLARYVWIETADNENWIEKQIKNILI
jgi:ABC-type branched-subunit amino acid transport system substrate-binding protein